MFQHIGETVIDPDALSDYQTLQSLSIEPHLIAIFGFGKSMTHHEYLLTADGLAQMAPTTHIPHIKLETLQVVGEYQGKPTPDLYANMLIRLEESLGTQWLLLKTTVSAILF